MTFAVENYIFFGIITVTFSCPVLKFNLIEMAYESKRALLISMGKNPDDRNLIKRMIER